MIRYLLLLLLFSSLYSQTGDEILVKVQVQSNLIPFALPKWIGTSRSDLEGTLRFDLSHSGWTKTIAETPRDPFPYWEALKDKELWQTLGASYVAQGKISDKGVEVRVFNLFGTEVKHFGPLPIGVDPLEDRRQVHRISDAILKEVFGKEGIATTKILFSQKGQGWNSDIFEADYDGEGIRQLTDNAGYCITPIYVPPSHGFSSGSFLYVSYLTGQPKIYAASFQGKKGQRLSLLNGNQLMPALTRARDKLAFISDVSGNPDLFIQDFSPKDGLTGKPKQLFASKGASQASPSFDPEGKQIAFVSNKDGSPRIYVMPVPKDLSTAKNITPKLLTKFGRECTAPCWSKDGKRIAYCSLVKGVRQIFVYDFDNDEERQLTDGPGHKENPSFAPDSLHIVFNSTGALGSELYLINLNEPLAVKISGGPGEKRFPSWEIR